MDTLYHIGLGLGFLLVLWMIIAAGPSVLVAALIAAFILYFREVTQEQTKHFDSDIRKGWDFRLWSNSKNLETWVPVGATLVIGAILWFVF